MKRLYGITAAMITPFKEQDAVDTEAAGRLTRLLIDKGISCLYPCGTTGEMLRMSPKERRQIAEAVVTAAKGEVPVFVHCGSMCQDETIELVRHAQNIGAAGAGVVTPQFFKSDRRELLEYYRTVADAAPDFPIYLYNIPQCAANDIEAELAEQIAEDCPNVVGIKYSYADINRTIDYLNVKDGSFSVLHGCDRALVAMLALGCDGTVSGTAGVFPEPFVKVYKSYEEGRLAEAQKLQKLCVRFCDALKCGSNMSYFKEALKIRGIDVGGMRKPQLDLKQNEVDALKKELKVLCGEADIPLKLV
ncbi:dihydrodipicolinate synthase family protein [Extibacter muris]|uniref:dihydrodipicolinate synthase family protein n=1 Tax=Extibacter muris TaxID=1796622 RepID=UPI001D078916|nr:dihydrodipicolinate synthase family protein [Extibacter muris]MCB6200862.1 dihydrodipicolinate synthase family protein [Extibacter muris]MCQ4662192.1 dihydrodipicolinate synthase family protein [Extibacter muris]MCQ4691894.1 dihydrodipicolinate synthase family protein [Extibacter muris]